MNVQGDPSAALLEVLDTRTKLVPFMDNYLETTYDLTKVLFIATANNLSTIHPALLDRMEIIDIADISSKKKLRLPRDISFRNS